MKKLARIFVFVVMVILYAVAIPVAYAEINQDGIHSEPGNKKQNGIIIQYKENTPKMMSLNKNTSSKIKSRKKISQFVELIYPDQGVDNPILIEELKDDGSILYVEEDKKLKLYSQPNDPGYSKQWGLKNIMAEEAWAILPPLNKSVVVAVIDSGLETTHFDLVNRIADGGYNFFSYNSNFNDTNGHGTAVSGVIAAETNNGVGIAGVVGGLDVKLLPLKTADNNGYSQLSDVIRAIDYAIEKNVDAINISMGSSNYSDIENAAVQRAIQNGIVVVAAAGNEGAFTYNYPASYDGVISVGSIASNNVVSEFSNYNDKVDVVAPGEKIYSCHRNNSYTSLDGTSFSAPIVSGVAAILKGIDPSLRPDQILAIIQNSAVDLGPVGRDNRYGYGAVNLYQAVSQFAHVAVTDSSKTDVFTEWDPVFNVPLDKTWKVEFSLPLDISTVKEQNIYVTDNNNTIIPMFYYQGSQSDKNIYVIPIKDYNRGETYTLWIKGLIACDGKILKKNIKMDFTTIA
ncbi:MAG: S8 family serine peptidase [Syntrophomonadaceae bacterium]|nr:S8 family serine peptidase [Syntrophomonadaceae bacterium]